MMMVAQRLVLVNLESDSNDSNEFRNHTIGVQGCKDMEEDTLRFKLKIERQHPPQPPQPPFTSCH